MHSILLINTYISYHKEKIYADLNSLPNREAYLKRSIHSLALNIFDYTSVLCKLTENLTIKIDFLIRGDKLFLSLSVLPVYARKAFIF